MIIAERWPKSALDITITVLEAEDDRWWGDDLDYNSSSNSNDSSWGMMNVLAGCITVASAAIADARIDCLDLATGGVAALVLDNETSSSQDESSSSSDESSDGGSSFEEGEVEEEEKKMKKKRKEVSSLPKLMLDTDPAEHESIVSMCVVSYLPSRDEITEVWLKGDSSRLALGLNDSRMGHEALIDGAADAARGAHMVLVQAVRESAQRFLRASIGNAKNLHNN